MVGVSQISTSAFLQSGVEASKSAVTAAVPSILIGSGTWLQGPNVVLLSSGLSASAVDCNASGKDGYAE